MVGFTADPDVVRRVDDLLVSWRQGDLVLGELSFAHVGDAAEPLTGIASGSGAAGLQMLATDVAGLVVITQTCDLVRSCARRPFLRLAPLVPMGEDELRLVRLGHRPRFATFAALAARDLVADLDRAMTVEKSIVTRCARIEGCADDDERRRFAAALARSHARFAFPDEFTAVAGKLSRRMIDKHEKESPEGLGLRALREIRVQATPSWDAQRIELFFWFVQLDPATTRDGEAMQAELLAKWLALVQTDDKFTSVEGQVTTLEDMTAAQYVTSDPLDLDRLSARDG